MKKKVCYVLSLWICLVLGGISSYFIFNNSKSPLKELPLPEVTGGERGTLGIDKNINEETKEGVLSYIIKNTLGNESISKNLIEEDCIGNYELENMLAILSCCVDEPKTKIIIGILSKPILWNKKKVQLVIIDFCHNIIVWLFARNKKEYQKDKNNNWIIFQFTFLILN